MDSEKLKVVLAFDVDRFFAFHERECYEMPDTVGEGVEVVRQERERRDAKALVKWNAYLRENGIEPKTQDSQTPRPQVADPLFDVWLPKEDFETVVYLTNSFFAADVERFEKRTNNGVLPKAELLSQEIGLSLDMIEGGELAYYYREQPILKSDKPANVASLGQFFGLVKFVQWLDLQGKTADPLEVPAGKLKWTGEQIELITLFFDLKKFDLLRCSKADLNRVLRAVFVDKDGKPFSESYIEKILKPDGEKSKNRVNLAELI